MHILGSWTITNNIDLFGEAYVSIISVYLRLNAEYQQFHPKQYLSV